MRRDPKKNVWCHLGGLDEARAYQLGLGGQLENGVAVHMYTRHTIMANFPTIEDFRLEAQENAIKWREVPLGIFRIVSKHNTKSKFGPGMLLQLENAVEDKIVCWACTRLVTRLNDDPKIQFILNEGLKQSETEPSNQYFAFTAIRGC